MTEHDPLCCGETCWEGCPCNCDLIAKSRADERKKLSSEFWCHVCDRPMRLEWLQDKFGGGDRRAVYCSGCSYGYITLMETGE